MTINLEAEVLELVVELSLEHMTPLGVEVLLDLVVLEWGWNGLDMVLKWR
jgi:hypothetical protein